jgi:AcrR family transcriptional regulator
MAMKKVLERAPRSDGARSRRAILDAAAKLATVEGLEGMSIGRLAEHIGMSKSGLYAHFGSKEELQLATVRHAEEIFDAEVIQPAISLDDPIARLLALGEAYFSHLERRVFPGGCFFASTIAELDTRPGPVKELITQYLRDFFALLVGAALKAQQEGAIRVDEDIEQLAFELDAYLTMANEAFLMSDEVVSINRGRRAYETRIERALAAPGATELQSRRVG